MALEHCYYVTFVPSGRFVSCIGLSRKKTVWLTLRRYGEPSACGTRGTVRFRVPPCKPRHFPSPRKSGSFDYLFHVAHVRTNPLLITPFCISRQQIISLAVTANCPPSFRLNPLRCARHPWTESCLLTGSHDVLKRCPYKCVADL